jgi:hypothetical protein
MEPKAMRIMLIANMAVSITCLLVLTLEAFEVIQIFDRQNPTVTNGVRILFVALTSAFILANIFFVYETFIAQRASHLSSRTGANDFKVSVNAVEESLSRIARCIPDVHDARVSVYKDRADQKPVLIEVSYSAYEDVPILQVTDRIREVVAHRFEEIAGAELKPQFNIILSRIVEKEARPRSSKPKESKVIDLSKGPIYPVADDIPS